MPMHLELEQRFSRMIRNGYMARNPISAEWVRQIRSGFPDIEWGDGTHVPVIRSNSTGFSIIGTSGIGKTTAIESVLSLYPQVIVHTKYNDHSFDQHQLVWLKLDCPFDGSVKGMCINFFQAVDSVLQTNYYKKLVHSKSSVDDLLPKMAMVASSLGLGVLVMDEIQRLNEAKSGGAKKMLNFFVQLTNTIGIPVVFVGTYKGQHLVTSGLAEGRRGVSQGDVIWAHYTQGPEWEFFIESLWELQWTNVPAPLTEQIKTVMYEETQGITDLAVKLYMLVQWSLIGQEKEKITVGVIRRVAKESFRVLAPMMRALKSGDTEKLVKYGDIYISNQQMDEFLRRANERVTVYGALNTLRNQQIMEKEQQEEESALIKVAKWLVQAGIEPKNAKEYAAKALEKHAAGNDMKLVKHDAFKMALHANSLEVETKQEKQKKKSAVRSSNELLDLVSIGKEEGKSASEVLKEQGIRKPADQLL